MKDQAHFYLNKYIASPLASKHYKLCFSSQYRFLWFRVAKCGSRTIYKHLRETTDQELIYSSPTGYFPSMYKNFLKFAFIRNPLDRFQSAWRDKVLKYNFYGFPPEEYERMQEFDHFLQFVEQMDLFKADVHVRPQHHLIDLNNIDFIGRNEYFEKDLRTLFGKLGVPLDNIAHENRSKSKDKNIELTTDQERRIAELYELDFRLFYPRELERIMND